MTGAPLELIKTYCRVFEHKTDHLYQFLHENRAQISHPLPVINDHSLSTFSKVIAISKVKLYDFCGGYFRTRHLDLNYYLTIVTIDIIWD